MGFKDKLVKGIKYSLIAIGTITAIILIIGVWGGTQKQQLTDVTQDLLKIKSNFEIAGNAFQNKDYEVTIQKLYDINASLNNLERTVENEKKSISNEEYTKLKTTSILMREYAEFLLNTARLIKNSQEKFSSLNALNGTNPTPDKIANIVTDLKKFVQDYKQLSKEYSDLYKKMELANQTIGLPLPNSPITFEESIASIDAQIITLENNPQIKTTIIGANVLAVCPVNKLTILFYNSSEINARAVYESREVLVSTGLLTLNISDGEMAFTLAHEIGHHIARQTGADTNVIETQLKLDSNDPFYKYQLVLTPETMKNRYAQLIEFLADAIGLSCIQKAGYSASDAGAFFGRMQFAYGSTDPNMRAYQPYFSDHPYFEDRINFLRQQVLKTA